MQEQVSASLQQMSEMAAPKNVPTLDEVRDKIEKRYAVALGQADLAQGTMGGRLLDVKRATLDLKGSARLDEIRASLVADNQQGALGAATPPAVEAVPPSAAPSAETLGAASQQQGQPEPS
jgi:hypothetical protein